MSSIAGVGRSVHHPHFPKTAKLPSTDSTSLTASTLSGTVTGSLPALGAASTQAKIPSGLLKQIEQAVTNALQTSKPTDDPHKVIRDAITNVLKKNAGSPSSQDDASASDTTDADGTHRTFDQTLQAYGVTPQQFRAQVLAAIHAAGASPTAGTASNISSFPPGLVLDTAA
jgi:hypothetical protein